MPVLHMNVESVREVQAQLVAAEKTMTQAADGISQRLSSLIGTDWKADSATQFSQDFQAWYKVFQIHMQTIVDESTRLGAEVDRWEEVARNY